MLDAFRCPDDRAFRDFPRHGFRWPRDIELNWARDRGSRLNTATFAFLFSRNSGERSGSWEGNEPVPRLDVSINIVKLKTRVNS